MSWGACVSARGGTGFRLRCDVGEVVFDKGRAVLRKDPPQAFPLKSAYTEIPGTTAELSEYKNHYSSQGTYCVFTLACHWNKFSFMVKAFDPGKISSKLNNLSLSPPQDLIWMLIIALTIISLLINYNIGMDKDIEERFGIDLVQVYIKYHLFCRQEGKSRGTHTWKAFNDSKELSIFVTVKPELISFASFQDQVCDTINQQQAHLGSMALEDWKSSASPLEIVWEARIDSVPDRHPNMEKPVSAAKKRKADEAVSKTHKIILGPTGEMPPEDFDDVEDVTSLIRLPAKSQSWAFPMLRSIECGQLSGCRVMQLNMCSLPKAMSTYGPINISLPIAPLQHADFSPCQAGSECIWCRFSQPPSQDLPTYNT
ncbi:hypothetical protein DFH28DRAFT_938369 [Melampsora americana]|nr:hypothetical protein DFH28DRAFT_938369 [Melampsora americana]